MTLPNLIADTGKRVTDSMISGITHGRGRFTLIQPGNPYRHGRGSWIPSPQGNVAIQEIKKQSRTSYVRHLKTFQQSNDLKWVNKDLLGGDNYPLVEGLLSLIPGPGIGFGLSTLGVNQLSATHPTALARLYDKIYQIEKIGLYAGKPTHVAYFLLVDPYRKTTRGPGMGWLFHEERHTLTLTG